MALGASAYKAIASSRDDVAASCLDDQVQVCARAQIELVDGRRHHADDPCQTTGADDDLGVGAMRDDPLDNTGNLVAGGE